MASADAVMRRWFDVVWNRKQESAVDELMAPTAVFRGIGPVPISGPAGFKAFYHPFLEAFPDLHIDVISSVTEGNRVAAHIRCTGTHSGSSLGPATNQTVTFEGMVFGRVEDGQLAEGWNCIDFLTMYQQMGWVSGTLPA